ncbi:Fc.00g056320.m01.CDS01 [Cosmosporella sp. VM-42]
MDRPASPRPIDQEIAEAHGESVALDATREKLEANKLRTDQSPQEIIVERTREIGRLRAEVAYLQEMRRLGEYLCEEVEYVIDRLQLAVVAFHKGRQQVEEGGLEL